jgi:hypothetical protein
MEFMVYKQQGKTGRKLDGLKIISIQSNSSHTPTNRRYPFGF